MACPVPPHRRAGRHGGVAAMRFHRPTTAWPWTRTLPASLTPEQVRDLHGLSQRSGRTIRRIVTTAVSAALDDPREGTSWAA